MMSVYLYLNCVLCPLPSGGKDNPSICTANIAWKFVSTSSEYEYKILASYIHALPRKWSGLPFCHIDVFQL